MKLKAARAAFALGTLVLSYAAVHAASDPNLSRTEADRKAKAALLDLHFFAEGDGMHMAPDLINAIRPIPGLPAIFPANFKEKWGLITGPGNWPVGLHSVPYEGTGFKMKVGVLGCAVCHSGKAAGQFIPGLGNKNIDVVQLGQDVVGIQKRWIGLTGDPEKKSAEHKRVADSALKFASSLAEPKIGNLTQGMVPVSFIRTWFYEAAGLPYPLDLPRGAVKIPFLWGYGLKRKAGQFCDGYGDGVLPGWAIAVELVGGQRPEVVRRYLPKVEAAEELFSDFLPPKYPLAIDVARAERGRVVFEKTCMGCHGPYENDADGLPVYREPRWIPLKVVGTDDDRLNGNTSFFDELVAKSPLSDLIQARSPGRGYFAPRLEGIWARFPYLHNASVPSVAALLTAPTQRPRAFSLKDAGEKERFDAATLGLSLPKPGSREEKKLLSDAKSGKRDVYFTERDGSSSRGHEFGLDLPSDSKLDLIEYLKTL